MNKRMIATALASIFAYPQTEATETGTTGGTAPSPSTPPPAENVEKAPSQPAPNKPKPAAKKAKTAKPAKKAKAKKPSGASGKNKGVTGPAVLKTYAPNYVKGGKNGEAKTAGGNKTVDCGDKLSDQLRGLDLEAVYDKAVTVLNKALEGDEKPHTKNSLKAKYGKLNVGMQRMNLGNRMRAILFPRAGK